jgi:hypothetical protein
MHGTTLLDLPTELLQKTFDCLDWNRTHNLVPFRPDIIHISVTCRALRKAVLPILFRNVTLKLRWVNGALAEPGLLRLREQCPQLAKYARRVYVAAHFGHFRDPRSTMGSFSVPKELQMWLASIASAASSTEDQGSSSSSRISIETAAEMLLATSQCRAFLSNADDGVQARFRDLAYSLSELVMKTPGVFSLTEDLSSNTTDMPGLLGDETFFDDVREEARSPAVTEANGRGHMSNWTLFLSFYYAPRPD